MQATKLSVEVQKSKQELLSTIQARDNAIDMVSQYFSDFEMRRKKSLKEGIQAFIALEREALAEKSKILDELQNACEAYDPYADLVEFANVEKDADRSMKYSQALALLDWYQNKFVGNKAFDDINNRKGAAAGGGRGKGGGGGGVKKEFMRDTDDGDTICTVTTITSENTDDYSFVYAGFGSERDEYPAGLDLSMDSQTSYNGNTTSCVTAEAQLPRPAVLDIPKYPKSGERTPSPPVEMETMTDKIDTDTECQSSASYTVNTVHDLTNLRKMLQDAVSELFSHEQDDDDEESGYEEDSSRLNGSSISSNSSSPTNSPRKTRIKRKDNGSVGSHGSHGGGGASSPSKTSSDIGFSFKVTPIPSVEEARLLASTSGSGNTTGSSSPVRLIGGGGESGGILHKSDREPTTPNTKTRGKGGNTSPSVASSPHAGSGTGLGAGGDGKTINNNSMLAASSHQWDLLLQGSENMDFFIIAMEKELSMQAVRLNSGQYNSCVVAVCVMLSQCLSMSDVDTAVRILLISRNFYKLQRNRSKHHRHQHALLVPKSERVFLHNDTSIAAHAFWHPADTASFWLEVLMVLLSNQLGQAVVNCNVKQWELMNPRELFTTVKKVHNIILTQVTQVGLLMCECGVPLDVTQNTMLTLAKRFELNEDKEVALVHAVRAQYSMQTQA